MESEGGARRADDEAIGGCLEINQDLPFQRRTWIAERLGWALMTLLVLAALLGLFGGGPLSDGTAGDRTAAPLWLEYDRFARLLSPAKLRVHLVAETDAVQNTARVWLDRGYLSRVSLERVTPEPDAVEAGPEGVVFTFRMAPDPNQTPVVITFDVQPERFGLLGGRAGLAEEGAAVPAGTPINFSQFVYP